MMRDVAVVGGGLGGLATAIRLAHGGLDVVLVEKNERVGGKMSRLERGGYRWDMGPSLLTMPETVRELWSEVGRRAEDDLEFIELASTCRYRWSDGVAIDEDAGFWRRPEVAAYLGRARGVYELSADAFLRSAPGDLWRQFLDPRRLPLLRHLPKLATRESLHGLNARYFDDPHLLQIFDRFATYNGSSPYRTPAVFSIIPYVQARFRGHYLRGGMFALARAMRELAERLGVEVQCGREARQVRREGAARRVELADGGSLVARRVVCNMDAISAGERLFGAELAARVRRSRRPEPSTSGFILFLGRSRVTPGLDHHNILFSDDYPREFAELGSGQPAGQPTIYIAIGARSDPAMAPPGGESWFVLVNAPATGGFDWRRGARDYGERVLDRIGEFGIDARDSLEVCEHFTPEDFARRDNAWRGTLYGYASHGVTSSFRRPPLRRRDLPGVYFVGGTTHPGGGVPLVLLSGRIVAERILREFGG